MKLLSTFCKEVQSFYGWEVERDKVFEELSEFQTELSRSPYGRSSREKMLEETVDMEICIGHVRQHFGFTEAEVNKMMRYKMKRTLEEIEADKAKLETPLGKIGDRRERA